MSKTYLFYDIETSGLNPAFDQILQFAAIRTDLELNELERYECFIRPNPDLIISPMALLTSRIALSKLFSEGAAEYDVIKKIHALFNTPETISIGYNSLGFDDEFLRFSFYRNLLPPYTHQWAGGCQRFDLYPMAVVYYLFKNGVINWPTVENINSLKLEQLNRVNQFALGAAHNAMVDVEATLMLARAFYREKETWNYLAGCFDKVIDEKRLNELPRAFKPEVTSYPYRQGLLFDGVFGAENFYQCPVLFLGFHKHYKNQLLWLRLDHAALETAKADNFLDATAKAIYRKKVAEPGFVFPSDEKRARHLVAVRQEQVQKNLAYFAANQPVLNAIRDYYLEWKYPVVPNVDLDAALYQNGFLKPQEEVACRRFHQLAIEEKIDFASKMPSALLKQQALRLLGRNYFELLPENLAEQFQEYVMRVCVADEGQAAVDYRGRKRVTIQATLQEIATLKNKYAEDQEALQLLDELEQHLFGMQT